MALPPLPPPRRIHVPFRVLSPVGHHHFSSYLVIERDGKYEKIDAISYQRPMKKAPVSLHLILTGLVAVLLTAKSAQGQNLFVDTSDGVITQIAPDGTQSQFASGLYIPTALAFDGQGNLLVADDGAVEKFSPAGTESVFAQLSYLGAFAYDYGLAFDASGNLWASHNQTALSEFSPTGTELRTMIYQSEILSMAFDASGDLFTANGSASGFTIMERMPGQAPTTFASGINEAEGIAFNNAGDLFVAAFGNGDIYEYTPNGAQSIFAAGLDEPLGLAFDSGGNLFVTDFGDGDITEITPDGTQSTFATGLNHPGRLAFQGQLLPVPEPSSTQLLALGAIALALTSIRRRKRVARFLRA